MTPKGLFAKIETWVLIVLGASVLMGCSAGAYHFKRSQNVTDTFEKYRVLPDHRYYYSGNDYKPVALVGVQKEYTVSSPYWQEVQLNEKMLRTWMDRMTMQPGAEYNVFPNGAYILDEQGNPIGVWYAVWALPKMQFKSEKEIVISNPMTIFPHDNRGDDKGDDSRLD